MLALTTALRPPLFQRRRFCFRRGAVVLRRLAEQQGNGAVVAADLDAGHATGAVGGAHGTGKVALVEDVATAGAAAWVESRGGKGCRHRPKSHKWHHDARERAPWLWPLRQGLVVWQSAHAEIHASSHSRPWRIRIPQRREDIHVTRGPRPAFIKRRSVATETPATSENSKRLKTR